jgi:hypothetical protein
LENRYKDLNYIICLTYDVFDRYGLSTKEVLAKNKYCVIDLGNPRIVQSFPRKIDCMEYITILTNRVATHRKLKEEQLH